MTALDKRLHAYRPDLADARLKGHVEAGYYTEGRLMQVIEPLLSVYKAPRFDTAQLTQALLGERVRVFDIQEGWAFAQLERDRYVGYVSADALSLELTEVTHRVRVPSTFLYPSPDLKSQPVIAVTLNAALTVAGGDEKFAQLTSGRFAYRQHLAPIGQYDHDYVAIAQAFLNVPYYWGGKSPYGLDCSGLVQLALQASGIEAPRDSDMQEQSLGTRLLVNDFDNLKRGDLLFWEGHVGIMSDPRTLLHANGHHMMTVAEPLREAVERIAASGKPVTSIKRL